MPPSDAARQAVPEMVRRFAVERVHPAAGVVPLLGDASTRSYFRITAPSEPARVVALYDKPFEPSTFPFLEATTLFSAVGVPVPRVLDLDPGSGLILLEDLGDTMLQSLLLDPRRRPPEPEVDRLYGRAIDLIGVLQRDGTPRLDGTIHAGREALDFARLRYELEFFLTHYVRGLSGRAPSRRSQAAVGRAFDDLCARLDREPRVLCHRDYHSRNLMVLGTDLFVVDHQDARRGPDTYDLASLLRDAYVDVPESRVAASIDHFRRMAGSGEAAASFRARFDRMATQRTLKAAGTFAAQKVLYGRDVYLPYLPRVLRSAATSALGCEDLEPLRSALAPFVDEIREGLTPPR